MKAKFKYTIILLGTALFAWGVFFFQHSVYLCPALTYLDSSTGYLAIGENHGYLVNLNEEKGHTVEGFEVIQEVDNSYSIGLKGLELSFSKRLFDLEWKKNKQVEFNKFNFKVINPLSVMKVHRAIKNKVEG